MGSTRSSWVRDAPAGRMNARTPRAVYLMLGLLGVWAAVYQLSDTVWPALLDQAPFDWIWPDIVFAAAGIAMIAAGLTRERGWVAFGVGAICWAVGDVYWQLHLSALASPPVPSWADAGYLSFCPLAFVGILQLVRARVHAATRPLIADAVAAALATGAVGAAVVLEPVVAHARGGVLAIATNLAYPICDLALLGLLIAAMAVGEWRVDRRWLLLAASVIVFWIADSCYLVSVATSTYSKTQFYNGLWYLSPVLAAWAAWLPAAPAGSVQRALRGTSARGIVMLLCFALAATGVLVVGNACAVGVPAIVLSVTALTVVMARLVMTWNENVALLRHTQTEALTDALTAMANRRALTADLNRSVERASAEQPVVLGLFDLDGFKYYNDTFGHPAGDQLLARLGAKLSHTMGGHGRAYRMGGDEFCALIDPGASDPHGLLADAAAALREAGEGFEIGCSYGAVEIPHDTQAPEDALRLADQRMYANKRGGRGSVSRQTGDVLLRVLLERDPGLHTHLNEVAGLAVETAKCFALTSEEIEQIRQAAELHDVGKIAVPDAILDKPASLDEYEWEFMRRHTLIGERIINAAPALREVAALVRSSHENYDGTGYPDKLAGQAIPLGARIIAVCDAFAAMTTDRPYRKAMTTDTALAELERCAGTQFDPAVVNNFRRAHDAVRNAIADAA